MDLHTIDMLACLLDNPRCMLFRLWLAEMSCDNILLTYLCDC